MWDNQRSMNVARDLAAIRHTHTTLNDINRQENVAAAQDQQQLQAQQGFSERMFRQRQAEQSAYERDLYAHRPVCTAAGGRPITTFTCILKARRSGTCGCWNSARYSRLPSG